MSNISSSLPIEKRKSAQKNEKKLNMGLTYALGPFPDEPLISAIDKTLLLSSHLRKNSKVQKKMKILNTSFGTDCPFQAPPKLESISRSCPDLTRTSEEIFKEKIDLSVISSSSCDILEQCREGEGQDMHMNRMWTEKKITQNGIKSFEIWSEEVCKDSPSMIFIISPKGEVIPFEYLIRE